MSKKYICEVCQTEYDGDVCPECDTPRLEEEEKTRTSNPAWKKAAVAALSILLVLFAGFIAYEFLLGQSQSAHACTGLYLTESVVELKSMEDFYYLTVHVTPADTSDEILFQSTDESVATVNDEGKVETVAEGQAQIVVTCGNYAARCDVICDFTDAEE